MTAFTGWKHPDLGVLFVISGPSGVGKSTLVKRAREEVPALDFSVSATTRAPRRGEKDGVDYHFLDTKRFATLVQADAFLEHATVYDHAYGTLAGPTHEALHSGRSLVLDIDVQGARQIRDRLPDSVHIMIVPPSVEALETRLRARGTDDDTVIHRRMEQLALQLGAAAEYDYLIVNDNLSTTHRVFQSVLIAEMCRVSRRAGLVGQIRDALANRRRDAGATS